MLIRLHSFFALILTLLAVPAAQAHFLWLLPPGPGKLPTRMIFSDSLEPDKDTFDRFTRIPDKSLFIRDSRGQEHVPGPLAGRDGYLQPPGVGPEPCTVAAFCTYGVVQRGTSKPFLLKYYAKTFVGDPAGTSRLAAQPCAKLSLDISLISQSPPTVQVLWQNKPLANATVVLLAPGKKESKSFKADAQGKAALGKSLAPGLYGIRASHVEDRAGTAGERKFESIRHYSTLTLVLGDKGAPGETGSKKEDPEATKLLADARAARALYEHFPGFKADLEVNVDGQVEKGEVTVSAKGKVTVRLDREGGEPWIKNTLASTIAHRLDNGPRQKATPCAFVDEVTDHPLGRSIRVLNDEFHSSYRIRDRQVVVVNRHMPDSRFTITVIESHQTAEKKFLPSCFVVNTWDLKTDTLRSAETHYQTWQRLGGFDLPHTLLVLKATSGKLESRRMKLSNVQLEK